MTELGPTKGPNYTNSDVKTYERRIAGLETENTALRAQNSCLLALSAPGAAGDFSAQIAELQALVIKQKQQLLVKQREIDALTQQLQSLSGRAVSEAFQRSDDQDSDSFDSEELERLNFDYSDHSTPRSHRKKPERRHHSRENEDKLKQLQLSASEEERRRLATILSQIRVDESSDSDSIEERFRRFQDSR